MNGILWMRLFKDNEHRFNSIKHVCGKIKVIVIVVVCTDK